MERSESIAALAAALAKAQGIIHGAIKDTNNTFFKAKYADLASVKEAIQIPLSSNSLSYVQVIHNPDHGVGVETILMHSSGEWLSGGVVFVPVSKDDAQGYGSALTYARRYSLSAITGVAAEDDDGNAAAVAKPIKVAEPDAELLELANNAAKQGVLAYRAFYKELKPAQRSQISNRNTEFQIIATDADKAAAIADEQKE